MRQDGVGKDGRLSGMIREVLLTAEVYAIFYCIRWQGQAAGAWPARHGIAGMRSSSLHPVQK